MKFALVGSEAAVVVRRAGLFVKVVSTALDRIGRSTGAAAHDVGHIAVLVALVVVHVPGDSNDARLHRLLLFFQETSQVMLLRAGGVPGLFVGTGVGRMVQ